MGNIFSFSSCFSSNNVRINSLFGKRKMKPRFNNTQNMENLAPFYSENLITNTEITFDNNPPHLVNEISSPLNTNYITEQINYTSNNICSVNIQDGSCTVTENIISEKQQQQKIEQQQELEQEPQMI